MAESAYRPEENTRRTPSGTDSPNLDLRTNRPAGTGRFGGLVSERSSIRQDRQLVGRSNAYQAEHAARQERSEHIGVQDERYRNRQRAERSGQLRTRANEQRAQASQATTRRQILPTLIGKGSTSSKDLDVIYTVKMPTIIFFVGMGVIIDVFDFILGITGIGEIPDEIVDLIVDIVLPAIAHVVGIPLGGKHGGKKVRSILIAETMKVIPFVNIIPMYTWLTWRLIAISREEDREKAKERAKNT